MKKDQIYPSKYLKAADLRGRDITVTIENVEQVALQGKPSLLVYFKGKSKALIVKPAIFDQIERVTGEYDTDNWPGHSVTLFPTEQDFAGQTYDVIRVRTRNQPSRPVASEPAAREEPEFETAANEPDVVDDDIPF